MKQLVIISGKGGTGKTTVTASFAALADRPVLADCDVDAADLHLVLTPELTNSETFSGGNLARIDPEHCTACGKCAELCRFDAIEFDGPGNGIQRKTYLINPVRCEGCGVCSWFCAEKAIEFNASVNGTLMRSKTRFGPLAHARLDAGEENSGKLVTSVRDTAKKLAEQNSRELIIIDGSPGIGCPVIASITGADLILAVTEPTQSGRHDLLRVMELADHFGIPVSVAINKWNINESIAQTIAFDAEARGAVLAGRIRYDRSVIDALMHRQAIVEYTSEGAATDIRTVWKHTAERLFKTEQGGPTAG